MPSDGDFGEILSLIDNSRGRALAAINTGLNDLYWSVGEHISGRVSAGTWGQGTAHCTLAEEALSVMWTFP
jgi:hypothetical protein